MRAFIVTLFAVAMYTGSFAQIQAVTGTGDEVILYENHTWKYANKADTAASEIQTNPKKFVKSSSATFEVLSNHVSDVRIYLDPKKWKFKKADAQSAREYTFTYGNDDAYAMLISEKIQLSISSLRDLAIQNAIKVAPDIQVVKEEYRNVNGTDVLAVELKGTLKGIAFTYMNYYYTSESGTIQFDTYTSTNLFKEYQPVLEELLNGLVIKSH